MSVSEHIASDHALYLLALAPGDPERRHALEHAAQCEACQALLDESAQLLGLLDHGLSELPPLDPGLAARVQAALAPQPSRWTWLWIASGSALTLFLAWFALQHSAHQAQHDGVRCFAFEQGLAAVAFGLGALYARQIRTRLPALHWASIAMTGALAGQALLLLRCNANGAALHILLSHVLGVACATALGALLGRRLRPAM